MSGWETASLREVCDLIARGIAPKYVNEGGIAVINQRCVRDHHVDLGNARRHDNAQKAVSAERILRVGDVLVNSTGVGTLGRVAQIRTAPEEAATVDTHVTIVRPKSEKFYPDFFGYLVISIEEQLAKAGEGASGQTELSRSKIGEFEVTYPKSITEQKRIVAILDEAFEGIAKATANAERNLANARELFDSHLFRAEGDEEALGELIDIRTGKLDANAMVPGGAYPFFTCAREIFSIDEFAFNCEAVLLAGNNAVGEFNVKHYKGKFNAYQRTYVLTVNQDARISYRYLYYQLRRSLKKFKDQSVGVGTKFLKLGMIKGMRIPLPSIAVQHRIASDLDSLSEATDALGDVYLRKLVDLTELKRSLLHKAFSGQLTGKEAIAA